MNEASFLGPFTPVPRPVGLLAPPPSVLQAFTMQLQEHSSWCWAAVTASVCTFLNDPNPENREQCKVANNFVGPECCLNPMPAYDDSRWPKNRSWELKSCLERLDHYVDTKQYLSIADIADQIDNQGRPVCCYISFNSASVPGHFIAIIGYDRGREEVLISDPDPHGKSGMVPIGEVGHSFQGSWDESYFVK